MTSHYNLESVRDGMRTVIEGSHSAVEARQRIILKLSLFCKEMEEQKVKNPDLEHKLGFSNPSVTDYVDGGGLVRTAVVVVTEAGTGKPGHGVTVTCHIALDIDGRLVDAHNTRV